MSNSKEYFPKACIFDLGNTLINDSQITQEATVAMGEWLLEHALTDSQETFIATYTKINADTVRPFISHTYGELEFFEKTLQQLGVTAIPPAEALQKYREIVTAKFLPDRDILETFQFLRERAIKIALLSNERVDRVDCYMEQTGFREFFETIIVSEGIGVEKPDLRIFEEALTRLKIPGQELVMFGDNAIADGACQQLGITFVLVTCYRNNTWIWEEGEPHKPDYIIQKITRSALEKLFKNLKIKDRD
jgi:HAD superfamily hydrolase (TIGR01549 family)